MFVFGTAIALATDHWPAPARGSRWEPLSAITGTLSAIGRNHCAPAHIDIEGAAVFQNRRPDFALDSERSSCGCGQRHVG
jgi:hypothetical protein